MVARTIIGAVVPRSAQAVDHLGRGSGRIPRYVNAFELPLYAEQRRIVDLASAMAATPFDAEFIPIQICKTKLILFNSPGVDRDGGNIGGHIDSEAELVPGELGKDFASEGSGCPWDCERLLDAAGRQDEKRDRHADGSEKLFDGRAGRPRVRLRFMCATAPLPQRTPQRSGSMIVNPFDCRRRHLPATWRQLNSRGIGHCGVAGRFWGIIPSIALLRRRLFGSLGRTSFRDFERVQVAVI